MLHERVRPFFGNAFNRRVSMFQERLRAFYGSAFYCRVSMFKECLRDFTELLCYYCWISMSLERVAF